MPIELTARRYGIAVGAVLVAEASLLLWNAWRYAWLHGYDAYAELFDTGSTPNGGRLQR